MSTKYWEHLEELFVNIHEDIISNLRKKNKRYSELITIREKQSTKIMEIIQSLNDEDEELISDNKDCISTIQWVERQEIYFQGYRDCIDLLKNLEII
jgi:hypothetical protein